jgi:hypothetical protein
MARLGPAKQGEQMPHTFRLQDRVKLIRNAFNTKSDVYRIRALLPERDGEPQYRIQPDVPGPERVAMQADLQAVRSSEFDS